MKDEPDASVNIAAIAFKEGKFHEAREMYLEAMSTTGFQADLAYNIALCYYKENDFEHSLKHVTDVIKHGVQEHPEFSVGRSNLGGVEVDNSFYYHHDLTLMFRRTIHFPYVTFV